MCSTLNHLFVVLLTCFAGNKDVEPRFGNGCTAAVTEGSSLVNVYIHRLQFSMGVFNTNVICCTVTIIGCLATDLKSLPSFLEA